MVKSSRAQAADCICADKARDIRKHAQHRACTARKLRNSALLDGNAACGHIRRRDQGLCVKTQQQMVHRRVSHDANHADLRGSYPGILRAPLCKCLKRFPDACGKRPRAVCLRILNARNNVRAILRLRVQTAPLRQQRAAYAIAQAADDRRCAKVDGKRICRLSVRVQRLRLSGRENFSRMARGQC